MAVERKSERKLEKTGTRSDESRYSEERLKKIRNNIQMSYSDPFYIPTEKIPPGITYYWCRVHIRSNGTEPDYGRLADMMDRGWDPVPIERHPEFQMTDMVAPRGMAEGSVMRLGHVLVERPTFLSKEEQDVLVKQIQQSLNTIPYQDGQSYGGLQKTDWRQFRGSNRFEFD